MSYPVVNSPFKAGNTPDAFASGTPAWHRVFRPFQGDEEYNVQAAMKAGGLDYDLGKFAFPNPLIPGETVNEWGVFRLDTNACLGTCKEGYEIVTNAQAFAFLEEMLGAGNIRIDSCGTFEGGAFAFANIQVLNKTFEVVPGDVHHSFYQFVTSHNGFMKFTVFMSFIRMVCGNTVAKALKKALQESSLFGFKHTKNAKAQIENAKEWLALAGLQQADFVEKMKFLTTKRFREEIALECTQELLGFTAEDKVVKFKKNNTEEIKGNRKTSLLAAILGAEGTNGVKGIEGTAYELFNKVTNYCDHVAVSTAHANPAKGVSKYEAHAQSAVMGALAKRKTEAFDLILQYAQKA
jgi:phage/plasmid-like protein (TIGR03299 family)